MKSLKETLQHLNSGVLNINESEETELMTEIHNKDIKSGMDVKSLENYIDNISDNDLFKLSNDFFKDLIQEIGEVIPNNNYPGQSKTDPNYNNSTFGIPIKQDKTRYSKIGLPVGNNEHGVECASVVSICLDSHKNISISVLVEDFDDDVIYYFPLKDVIKQPGKKFKTDTFYSKYILFNKFAVVDIIVSIIKSYIEIKYEKYKNHQLKSKPKPKTEIDKQKEFIPKYTSISQFRKDYSEIKLYDLLVKLGIKNHHDKFIINTDNFDKNAYELLGNNSDSRIIHIEIGKNNKVYFGVRIIGRNTDDTRDIPYDDFVSHSNSIYIHSDIANTKVYYTEEERAIILGRIVDMLERYKKGEKNLFR